MRGCVLVGLIAAGAIIVVAVVAGFIMWRGFVGPHGSARAAAQEIRRDATTFAKGKTDQDCLAEGLRRTPPETGLFFQVRVQTFVDICADRAARTGLCDRVPENILKISQWSIDECKQRGRTDDACIQILNSFATHCRGRRH